MDRCYTCRLRRKKCDEGKPGCRACNHLGVSCVYKRPMWWSNTAERTEQRELVRKRIKLTRTDEKLKEADTPPPSLCKIETFSDSRPLSRTPSVYTPYAPELNFKQVSPEGYPAILPPEILMSHPPCSILSRYEVDINTECQICINDVPNRRDSTLSTFSTFQPPPMGFSYHGLAPEIGVEQDYLEMQQEFFPEEPVNFDFFDLPHKKPVPNHETVIEVDEVDKSFLNHFIQKVSKLIFPILDANQHSSTRSNIILPALGTNKSYLHCCLSVSGLHKKSTEDVPSAEIDEHILRHRYAAMSELCAALNEDKDHARILEATFDMILFQYSVGRLTDSTPDIPWHQHFQAAADLVNRLELPTTIVNDFQRDHVSLPPFNMALTTWIDILGATMLGRQPRFADTYCDLIIGKGSAGLSELMGCDDNIVFLISEIACLEAHKLEGMDSLVLCDYVKMLGHSIGYCEPGSGSVKSAFSGTGTIKSKRLRINVTAAFMYAARMYLCSLVPGFRPDDPNVTSLVNAFCNVMGYIPAGMEGHDRSLVWPLLMVGSVFLPTSSFRNMFDERCSQLGEAARFGPFGRIRELSKDVWVLLDSDVALGSYRSVSWRDVKSEKGWDFLLIREPRLCFALMAMHILLTILV
ncbi:hypothetical protein D6C78_05804 [Aureobasidium pullulans]|uniref:Zn(2)-C6 fungal-type domain-containing protein n=1 Tax=Aureobasidium pullulans TaxID=5580 RepID=A0A4T0BMS9_AURPU|nr:hypothetical protein D6C78_05804 [Aureobasidium pullulans]